eukprot:TRINITY_DN1951_c0_g2_i1.p1 TRINITY_DN1951_c0_g2~~TRINITY_DN1951_c0_g2_i1.p1  ORF type:complete len:131 (+),score=37.46 TRINITY_DN1951_c0_g2_i1:638-1030(+)
MHRVQEEEDAGVNLQLGSFSEEQTLSISDLRFLLEHKRADSDPNTLGDIFDKTYQYADKFCRSKNQAAIDEARAVVDKYSSIHPFEGALLRNLQPENYEEAYVLIPSLEAKIPMEHLDELLDDLSKVQQF